MIEKFPVGQWVRVLNPDKMVEYYGCVEEVVTNGYTGDDNVLVMVLVNKSMVTLSRAFTVVRQPRNIEVLEDEKRIFTDGELDVALLTKDIVWCRELWKLKGKVGEGVGE